VWVWREAKLSVEHSGVAEATLQAARTRSDGVVRQGQRERHNACWVAARLRLRVGGEGARRWVLGRPKAASMPSRARVSTRACWWLGHNGGPASAHMDALYDDRYKQGGRGQGVARQGGATQW
jgi:hypothetical protein